MCMKVMVMLLLLHVFLLIVLLRWLWLLLLCLCSRRGPHRRLLPFGGLLQTRHRAAMEDVCVPGLARERKKCA
jgi:hypothetical protein